MVGAGDGRHLPQFLGPRDALEELVRVEHVRLDLLELVAGEAAARDREDVGLVRRDEGLGVTRVVHEGPPRDASDARRRLCGQDGGLVGRRHRLQMLVDLREQRRQLGVPLVGAGREAFAAPAQERVEFLAQELQLEPALQDLGALANQLETRGGQLLGLDEHVLANANLAEVVKERGIAELADLVGREAHVAEGPTGGAVGGLGEGHREIRDAEGVAGGGGVPRFDGADGGADEALEEDAHALVEAAVLEGHRRLRGEGGGQALEALGVGEGLGLDLLGRGEAPRGVALAVDQLEDADDVVARRLHGHHEHGLRAVARVLVEAGIDVVSGARGRHVGVVQVDDLSRQGDVARDALVADGHGGSGGPGVAGPRKWNGRGIVLGDLEAEAARLALRLLHEVDRPRVAAGDLAGSRQDETQQRLHVALGGEPDADLVELLELAPRGGGLAAQSRVVEGLFERALENGPGHRLAQAGIPARRQGGLGRRRGGQRDDRHVVDASTQRSQELRRVALHVHEKDGGFVGGQGHGPAQDYGALLEIARQQGHQGGHGKFFRAQNDARGHAKKVGWTASACQERQGRP